MAVVSAFAPVDRRRFGHPASRSGRLQDAERDRGSAHVLPTPRCRGNMLAHAGPAAQEVSELVVAAALGQSHRQDRLILLLASIVDAHPLRLASGRLPRIDVAQELAKGASA